MAGVAASVGANVQAHEREARATREQDQGYPPRAGFGAAQDFDAIRELEIENRARIHTSSSRSPPRRERRGRDLKISAAPEAKSSRRRRPDQSFTLPVRGQFARTKMNA